ncbi:porin [Aquabacterium sp. A7-Y]|uniref:porin n=1 Tax=Aquabacterium sp. A7-Y TaxID=1349605 RepID=UPI00223D22E3|nr:porin [Aquabacterium sp. A7-Y]MCW7539388.1 porin [Aquabacterium sp. A7-Y]
MSAPLLLPALAALFVMATAPLAAAQSSLTLQGELDVAVDRLRNSEGDVSGTLFANQGDRPLPNHLASPRQSHTRMALRSPSYLALGGVEDLGGGWHARFRLESSLIPGRGSGGNNGRFFSGSAWVGLTTPVGEFRLGRQASPMLTAIYLTSVGRVSYPGLLSAGILTNNLQAYQDNQLSYVAGLGPWIGLLSVSSNAGVASRISAARSDATGLAPVASETTGQVLGGGGAGAEASSGRGRTWGVMAGYVRDQMALLAAYHHNRFGVPLGLATPEGGFVPLFHLESFSSVLLAARYRPPGLRTELTANVHSGQFRESGPHDPKTRTLALGLKHPLGPTQFSLQVMESRFVNFTRGRDRGVMLGLEHALSKRTALYARLGTIEDQRGRVVHARLSPLPLAGGPTLLLLPLGTTEVPVFFGNPQNMDARTSIVSLGVRHAF